MHVQYVAVVPRVGSKQLKLLPGARPDQCRKCAHPVWVHTDSDQMIREHGAELLCTECAAKLTLADSKPSLCTGEARSIAAFVDTVREQKAAHG